MSKTTNPFTGPAPAEVPLSRAPLAWVIAQVKHSTLLAVHDPAHLAKFQIALRNKYPLLGKEQSLGIKISGDVVVPDVIWRFSDVEKNWRVSLHPEFVSIEAKTYTSRSDFLDRISFVVKQVKEVFDPAQVTRIGVRYLDVIDKDAFADIQSMINPKLLGFASTDYFPLVSHTISEASIAADEGAVTLRWGKVPKDGGIDPALPMMTEDSWILDIDIGNESPQDYVPSTISSAAESFCKRIYSVFRWAVTDNLLKSYGGQL